MYTIVTKEQVLEALKQLEDPQLHKGLVENNMVRDIMIKERTVYLTIGLSVLDDEIKSRVQDEVKALLKDIGCEVANVRFRQMTDYERNEILARKPGLDEMQVRRQAELQAQGMPELLSPESPTKFIAVASGKGGVGKSTVTVNLAVALARKGKKVGLIDADIYGFSVPDMMGITDRPELVDNAIVPIERHGVKVISMGFFVEDNSPIIWRGPMLGKMLRNFFKEVNWGELDYVLLDLPPGTGDIAMDVHQMIPQSKEIIVTTPHGTAAFVAARAGAMALHTNHEILGVVENMAYYECGQCGNKDYIFGRGGGAKLAEELHTELIGQIPLGVPDNHPSEADFSPSVYKADTSIGKIYLELADNLIAKLEG